MMANYAYFYVLAFLAAFLWPSQFAMQPALPAGEAVPAEKVTSSKEATPADNARPVKKAILAEAASPIGKSIPAEEAVSSEKATPFEKLTQKFENGQVFNAQFSHEYVDSYTGDRSTQSGEIWIGDEEYKIESAAQRVAVDGEISRVYDSNRGRLIISAYVPEEDDFAPSRILNGVDSTYVVVEQEQKGDAFLIRLQSDDPFAMFQEVEITLNENSIPTKIFVRDPADNEITTTFSGGTFISRSSTMFDLSYPDSAEVVDMRN